MINKPDTQSRFQDLADIQGSCEDKSKGKVQGKGDQTAVKNDRLPGLVTISQLTHIFLFTEQLLGITSVLLYSQRMSETMIHSAWWITKTILTTFLDQEKMPEGAMDDRRSDKGPAMVCLRAGTPIGHLERYLKQMDIKNQQLRLDVWKRSVKFVKKAIYD